MLQLIKKYPALLAFGILTAAFSSPGQTFLVSLFIPHMREAFSMTKTEIASYYSAATLVSALILPWSGRVLDRSDLLSFTLSVGALLAVGCYMLSQSMGVVTLFIGFLLIRNLGQGTVTMISSTTMARIFGSMRGKALGISNLGYPIGEAFFPMMVASWILSHGWRSGWMFLMGLVVLFFIPAVFILLMRSPHKKAQAEIAKSIRSQKPVAPNTQEVKPSSTRDWTVREMLSDWRFYVLAFPILIPPTFFTAIFFYQVSLFEWKSWSIQLISMGFVAFGISRAIVSFLIGPIIDRHSARKVFPINLIPLGIGLFCFLLGQSGFWGFIYLGLAGMTMGLSMTISSALYAEFYGVKELGSIRGITTSMIVFSTAVAPVVMGMLLDAAIDPSVLITGMIVCVVMGVGSAWFVCQHAND